VHSQQAFFVILVTFPNSVSFMQALYKMFILWKPITPIQDIFPTGNIEESKRFGTSRIET
jgi:hypothetical protein